MSDPSSRLAFWLVFAVRKKLRNTRGLSSFAKSRLSASFLCAPLHPRVQNRNLVEVPLSARFALSHKSFAFPWTSPLPTKQVLWEPCWGEIEIPP